MWTIYYPQELSTFEKMVLISEDRRFFRHNGIDIIAILREILRALTFRKHGGASTIDMQFVRTATGYYEYTLRRKTYEMLLAWLIQFKYTKVEILRFYLRRAFFGSHLYGAEKASKVHFGKDLTGLSDKEAAMIAAMLVYPRPRRPTSVWAAKVERRSNYILARYPRLKQCFEKLPSWESVDCFSLMLDEFQHVLVEVANITSEKIQCIYHLLDIRSPSSSGIKLRTYEP
jgi:membrane peptidoglycan carboxypeptidase